MKPNFEFLDEEEKGLDLLDPSTALSEAEKQDVIAHFKKAGEHRKNVTMRLSETVIASLKAKAEADGIPYQTLASMVLQKYVRGALLEQSAVRAVVMSIMEKKK